MIQFGQPQVQYGNSRSSANMAVVWVTTLINNNCIRFLGTHPGDHPLKKISILGPTNLGTQDFLINYYSDYIF